MSIDIGRGFLGNFTRMLNAKGTVPPGQHELEQCALQNQPQVEFGVIMILLVVIGLIGNIIVFSIIVILQEYKKSVTNWYILQLTVADGLFLLMLPFTAQSEIVGKWEFSLSLCKFKEAVIFINYYASIYFLMIMSFDRYLAVTKAFSSKTWMSTLRSPVASYVFSIFGWILSVLLCIQLFQYSAVNVCNVCGYSFPSDEEEPTLADFEDVDPDYGGLSSNELLQMYFEFRNKGSEIVPTAPPSNVTCGFGLESQTLKIWVWGNFVGAFCLPFLFICFFYGMIMSTIKAASKVGNPERQRSYRRRVTMIVLALVTLFAVSWLPWYVDKLVRLYGISLSPQSCKQLENSIRVLAYFNSALNPYFYSFLGTHFRDRVARASTRVGFSALRSRAATTSFLRRRKRSTSNSGGSAKPNSKNGVVQQCEALNDNYKHTYENVDPKISVALKTERTLV